MAYRALFLDLDGTTIPNKEEGQPSDVVTRAIKKAAHVMKVCVATSRPLSIAQSIIERAGFNGPCILNTGAVIYDPVRKKALQEYTLNPKVISTVYTIMKKYRIRIFMNDKQSQKSYMYDGKNVSPQTYDLFTFEMEPLKGDILVHELEGIPGIAVHKMPAWKRGLVCVDVTNPQASKLHGITTIAKILKIKTKDMIGVGDGYNDFPLLMACGLRIAMGNAVPELKAIADFIAPTVEEDGVATVIEKFILNGRKTK